MSGAVRFDRFRAFLFPVTLAAWALAAQAPRVLADLLLNEVLYDPAGTDAGAEFVELWNPDSSALPLAGIVLEAGDGANPGAWTTLYLGADGDSILPRSAFLVAGGSLAASVENGPDAIRLVRAGRVLDLLGYGALTAAELYEGAPAVDAASGESLVRRRDGVDHDANAEDWVAEPSPTPGRANRPDVRLSFVREETTVEPEVSWPGETVSLRAIVRNSGALAVAGSWWRMEVDLAPAEGGGPGGGGPGDPALTWTRVAGAGGSLLDPEARAEIVARFPAPPAGGVLVRARLVDTGLGGGAGSQAAGLAAEIADTLILPARAGAGPAVLSEIAFRDRGGGEWVELFFREAVEDLGRVALADRGSIPAPIDRGGSPRPARAGEYLVVAESPDELRARYALPESTVVGLAGGWPALNDEDGADEIADRVRVVGSGGEPWDVVPYRASAAAREGSLERLDPALPSASPSTWAETVDPAGGTPGRANSLRAPDPVAAPSPLLLASARVLRRDAGFPVRPVVLRVAPPAYGARLRVRVHDLLGRSRRLLVDGQRFFADAAFLWDGRDDAGAPVPPGIYVVRAEAVAEEGAALRSASLALTVSDRGSR